MTLITSPIIGNVIYSWTRGSVPYGEMSTKAAKAGAYKGFLASGEGVHKKPGGLQGASVRV